MRRLLPIALLTALALAAATGAATGASSPQVICISNSSPVQTPQGGYKVRPASCNFHAKGQPAADADMVQMRQITWQSWGVETALGSGKEIVNMVGLVPAKVRLGKPRSVCGHRIFTVAEFKGKKGGWSTPMQLDRRLTSTSCG